MWAEAVNWDAIGAVGEILGAIAVVATLGYLAIQTRHNVAATQTNTRQAILDSGQQFLSNLILDPGLDEIRWKPDLSDEEKRRLCYFFCA